MKILFNSYRFAPDVGGIETASAILAQEFSVAGHEVRLLTSTERDDGLERPFTVVRCPSAQALVEHTRWCDVFYQNNISLQTLWAALALLKPWVVTHQTWIASVSGRRTWRDYLKRFLLRLGTNVAISEAVAADIGVRSIIIGNPYRSGTFEEVTGRERDRELIFVGRLVSDKGVDLLVESLIDLRRRGLAPRLTVVGAGPEEERLRAQVRDGGLESLVTFAGTRMGDELAELLNAHRILVVPSRWKEPFGIVALEGIACGCVVVGSEGGGLKEAIGPCGLTFRNGDAADLTNALCRILSDGELVQRCRAARDAHLAHFEAAAVARRYLEVFESVIA